MNAKEKGMEYLKGKTFTGKLAMNYMKEHPKDRRHTYVAVGFVNKAFDIAIEETKMKLRGEFTKTMARITKRIMEKVALVKVEAKKEVFDDLKGRIYGLKNLGPKTRVIDIEDIEELKALHLKEEKE